MDINDKITGYIINEIKGNLKDDDRFALEKWLNESEDNKHRYEHLKELLEYTHEFEIYYSINKEDAWNKLSDRMNPGRRKIMPLTWYISAAVILLVIGFSIVNSLVFNKSAEYKYSYNHDKLYIEGINDNFLDIDSIEEGCIIEFEGARISKEENKLVYVTDNAATAKSELHTIIVPRGEMFNLVLADGSNIWINAGSRLVYPSLFDGKERKISLEYGEVFIEASHNPNKPFIINTMGINVKVLGTRFNVKAFNNENNVKVTLVEGKVRVAVDNNKKMKFKPVDILPGQQLEVNYERKSIMLKKVNTDIATAWLKGEYYFEEARLEEILNTLSRWYDYDMVFSDNNLKDISFTGRIKRYDNIKNVLNALSQYENVKFEINDKEVTVSKN